MKMIICNEINEYIKWCEENPDKVNNKRKLLIENIVKPILERNDIFFDSETYYKCISFCERWYYKLFPYQKFFYAFVFMYKDDIPVFRTFVMLMGRGGGKDGLMAPLLNFLQTPLYGVKNYHIDIVATAEQQSKDTFLVVYEMIKENIIRMKNKFYISLEVVINLATRSRLRYNTSNAKTKDGKKSGAILFNEYHGYETDDQIKVFQSQLGKIKHPRIFIITTQGNVRDGPLDELINVCDSVLNGESNELRYFPFLCELDDISEVDDPEKWIKANPSLPYMPVLKDNMMVDYLEMKKFPSKRPEFVTKRMNLPERNEDETITSWENIMKASFKDIKNKIERDIPELDRMSAICGIDFASLNDFATAGFLFKINGEYIWKHKTWICSNGKFFDNIKFPFKRKGQEGFTDFEVVNTSTIDEKELVGWVIGNMAKYNIKKIVMDNYKYKLIKKTFIDMGIDDVETKENPYGLIRMIRYPASIAAIVAPRIEVAFVNEKINIGNSAIMRWAVNNTCVTNKKDGNKSYEKIEPKLRKNDPFMAFVCAMSSQELLDEQQVYAYV